MIRRAGRTGRTEPRRGWATGLIILLWAAVVGCAGVALLRISGPTVPFPFVIALAYTPYLAVVSVVLAIVALIARRYAIAVVAVAAAGLIAVAVLPRMTADSVEPGQSSEVKLMALNLNAGGAEAGAVVELVSLERPDLVAFSELTPGAVRALNRAGLASLLAERVVSPAPGADGTGLYAVFPLRRGAGIAPAIGEVPMVRALVRTPRIRAEAVSVHTRAPTGFPAADRWAAGLSALPSRSGGEAVFLLGDFNATLDHPQLRDLIDRGYVDAADAVGSGLDPTWPRMGSFSLPVTIDHILVPDSSAVLDYETAAVPGTDHAAVMATVSLPPTPGAARGAGLTGQ